MIKLIDIQNNSDYDNFVKNLIDRANYGELKHIGMDVSLGYHGWMVTINDEGISCEQGSGAELLSITKRLIDKRINKSNDQKFEYDLLNEYRDFTDLNNNTNTLELVDVSQRVLNGEYDKPQQPEEPQEEEPQQLEEPKLVNQILKRYEDTFGKMEYYDRVQSLLRDCKNNEDEVLNMSEREKINIAKRLPDYEQPIFCRNFRIGNTSKINTKTNKNQFKPENKI